MINIERVCVVGAGNMGRQIALQFARCGFKVCCTDSFEKALKNAKTFAGQWVEGKVTKGKITVEKGDEIGSNLTFSANLKEAAQNADLVVEAVIEELEIKRRLFQQLDKICPSHTILATNSSYIVSSKIADITKRPEKVINMHFFNPALVMRLVEVVKGDHVAQETVDTVMEICRRLDKEPTLINKEIYGFVVNRIFSAITREACYLLDQGVASIEGIDSAIRNGLGHPIGPFQLLDLTGIDLEYMVLMEKYKSTGLSEDRPSPAIVERYAKEEYGKKTGRGFYDYNK